MIWPNLLEWVCKPDNRSIFSVSIIVSSAIKKIKIFLGSEKKLDIKRQVFSICLKIHLFFPP